LTNFELVTYKFYMYIFGLYLVFFFLDQVVLHCLLMVYCEVIKISKSHDVSGLMPQSMDINDVTMRKSIISNTGPPVSSLGLQLSGSYGITRALVYLAVRIIPFISLICNSYLCFETDHSLVS
jgi:hypothetical protein